MNKKLTNDQEKIDIVSKLLKEGNIDFAEALLLIQEEEYMDYSLTHVPIVNPLPLTFPYIPFQPYYGPNILPLPRTLPVTISDTLTSTFN